MLDKTTTTPTEDIKFVSLSMLRPGDDAPGGSINVRKTQASKEDDEKIKASILAEGVIQSLLACRFVDLDDVLYVAAGNRRLRLLNELVAEGKFTDYLVPVIIKTGITAAEARRLSAAENVARAPLHPVDRFEAFKQHVDDGMSEADIGAHYAMPKKTVKQALALGALSPRVRELWRAGKVSAEVAQTFTLGTTHEAQDAALDKLGGRIHGGYQVKHAILGEQRDVAGALKLVGKKEYEKAGGSVIEDLFEGGKYVSDAALLNTLVNNKLSEECDRLTSKEGWAWALTADDAGNERYSWRRLHAEPAFTPEQSAKRAELEAKIAAFENAADAGDDSYDDEAHSNAESELEELIESGSANGFTPQQKAKSGCIVSLKHNGDLDIEAGYVKPADKGKIDATDMTPAEREKAKKKKDGGGVSEALLNRLTETLTEAAGEVLTKDPETALCALLAGFVSDFGSPVRVSSDGMARYRGKTMRSEKFETAFGRLLDMTVKERNALLTRVVAEALDLRLFTQQRQSIQPKSVAAVTDALPTIGAELRKRFDAKDYFGSVSKPLCLKAIEEAVGKDEARKVAGKPKGEVAKFAVTNVPKTGWLPEVLRTAHYDGPGSKAAKGKTAKKPAARKKAA